MEVAERGLLKKAIAQSLIVICLFAAATSIRPVFSGSSQQVVSVWSEISIEKGGAYSAFGYSSDLAELPGVRDCLRPFPMDCFSLQQNFWISDYSGNQVLWARNLVYLANLGGTYHGTFSFQVYSRTSRDRPILCEPESNSSGSPDCDPVGDSHPDASVSEDLQRGRHSFPHRPGTGGIDRRPRHPAAGSGSFPDRSVGANPRRSRSGTGARAYPRPRGHGDRSGWIHWLRTLPANPDVPTETSVVPRPE